MKTQWTGSVVNLFQQRVIVQGNQGIQSFVPGVPTIPPPGPVNCQTAVPGRPEPAAQPVAPQQIPPLQVNGIPHENWWEKYCPRT